MNSPHKKWQKLARSMFLLENLSPIFHWSNHFFWEKSGYFPFFQAIFGRNQDIFHFSKQFLGDIRIFSIFPSNFWEKSGYFPFFQAIFGRNQEIFHFSKEIRKSFIFPSKFWEKSGDLPFFQRNQEIFHFSKQVLGEIRRSSIFPSKFWENYEKSRDFFRFDARISAILNSPEDPGRGRSWGLDGCHFYGCSKSLVG